uniref:carnosine N-methyltransferase-like isoform X2 n=1 Tax=Myxine glutinosa TaxID=7769 RepID=UPI003590077B
MTWSACCWAHALERINRAEKNFRSLPEAHRRLLPHFLKHLEDVRHCALHNAGVLQDVLASCNHMFENKDYDFVDAAAESVRLASNFDMDKLNSTLKQVVRDWTLEGAVEREACYRPIIDEISNHFPRDYWYRRIHNVSSTVVQVFACPQLTFMHTRIIW